MYLQIVHVYNQRNYNQIDYTIWTYAFLITNSYIVSSLVLPLSIKWNEEIGNSCQVSGLKQDTDTTSSDWLDETIYQWTTNV